MISMRRLSGSARIALGALLLAAAGCGRSRELTQMQADVTRAAGELVAQDAAARREIAQMQGEVTRAAGELVTQDAATRREIMQMQGQVARAARELAAQDAAARKEVIQMQRALDTERRRILERERQDPVIAAAILQLGGLLLCLLPMAVIASLFWRREPQPEVAVLNELVVDELLIDLSPKPELELRPELEPRRLEHRDLDALVRDRIAHRGE